MFQIARADHRLHHVGLLSALLWVASFAPPSFAQTEEPAATPPAEGEAAAAEGEKSADEGTPDEATDGAPGDDKPTEAEPPAAEPVPSAQPVEDAAAPSSEEAAPAPDAAPEPAADPAESPSDAEEAAPDAAAPKTAPEPPSPEVCEAVLEEKKKADEAAAAAAEAKRKEGFWWDKSLSVGASGLGIFNRTYVGQPDGFSATIGAFLNGALTLGYGGNIWENKLTVNEALVVSPSGDNFLKNPIPLLSKSADELVLSSEYRFLWQTFPYVGPYVRAQLNTRLFPTFVMRPDRQVLNFTDRDGNAMQDATSPYVPYAFASFFEPTTISEGAGVHIEPPTLAPWVVYSFKAGAQANHLLAGNGFVLADDVETPELELTQLSIVNSVGASGEAKIGGQVFDNVVWGLGLTLFYPIFAFGGNADQVGLLERTHVNAQGTISLKVTKWLSLDTRAQLLREPYVLNDWQFQASALLTAGFNLI